MEKLSGAQKKKLKALAHSLKPVVYIGQKGITDSVVDETELLLLKKELIKVKFIDFKEQKSELSEELSKVTGSHIVAIIGNVLILYRENSDKEKGKILL